MKEVCPGCGGQPGPGGKRGVRPTYCSKTCRNQVYAWRKQGIQPPDWSVARPKVTRVETLPVTEPWRVVCILCGHGGEFYASRQQVAGLHRLPKCNRCGGVLTVDPEFSGSYSSAA